MSKFGVSFSLHRCSELGINKQRLLKEALEDLGFRRFRLMSYWNIHEPKQGNYDFSELDWQLDLIASYGGEVSLCLGKRQPRWPECHLPEWAHTMPRDAWYEALYAYISAVVKRYKDHPALASWQLENEALLKSFGHCVDGDYNQKRLQHELELIKNIDKKHPVIMTLSDSWGLPIRAPRPDLYAMSLYRITMNKHGEYIYSKRPAIFYRLRRWLIMLTKRRQTFIHELQAEPWLAQAITEVKVEEQMRYMNPELLRGTIDFAENTGSNPIDLWGLEWWYWLREQGKPELWRVVKDRVKQRVSQPQHMP